MERKLTKQERQKIDFSIPKCTCGNNLSVKRIKSGIKICPACEKKDYEEELTRYRRCPRCGMQIKI